MPDWENNYLSWAFGLGCVGALFDFIAGTLFIVEARIIARKEIAREMQYPMEKAVWKLKALEKYANFKSKPKTVKLKLMIVWKRSNAL